MTRSNSSNRSLNGVLPGSGRMDPLVSDPYKSGMQITRGADYAVRVLIHLVLSPVGVYRSLSALSRATGAPESFLSKVLQCLCRAGYVSSRRGQIGGFVILPAGQNASLADVIAAMDGPFCLNACMAPGESCERKSFCPAHPVWAEAQDAMVAVLRSRTIAELASATGSARSVLVRL